MEVCRRCGVELSDENYAAHQKRQNRRLCKRCVSLYRRGRYVHITTPTDNKKCSTYLGVNIAEEVLSRIFKDVIRMPYMNHGYDFVCNKGMLIESKSGVMNTSGRSGGRWKFNTKRNDIADYFIFLAFDDRTQLNPLHIWLIPAGNFINQGSVSISLGTIDKWDEYRLPIDKVIKCCNTMR